ncbi:unnamed protein product [Clonostachys solani]|uniref:Xylose isomerase-like TIM barrel domain-containing protein n=1 Tax=Clonostachys solani TaxID=160281 RepID=A0A9N9ZCJ8_9HYPO|nr:unnamed protein product [Clonostachys solani]
MTEILRIRATWGVDGGKNYENFARWFPELKAKGYAGIEINVNGESDFLPDLPVLRKLCDDNGLEIVTQVVSHWPHAAGPRPVGLQPQQHAEYYRRQLEKAKELRPLKINAQSGAYVYSSSRDYLVSKNNIEMLTSKHRDYWTLEESVEFYKATIEIDAELGLSGKVVHETHRNRSLFTPYATAHIIREVPRLRITGDFSHHVVCCERLLDLGEEDKQLLTEIIPRVSHIHARIGTTQGSQCPDPSDPTFVAEKTFFDNLWTRIVRDWAKNNPGTPVTFTPEYGPYPYHAYNAVRDYSEVADTEGARLQSLFQATLASAN